MELSKETLTKIDEVVARYPEKRSATLMVIHLVQDEQGCISDEAVEWIAERLEVEPVNIYEVVTFYPMIRREPWGEDPCPRMPNPPLRLAGFVQNLPYP